MGSSQRLVSLGMALLGGSLFLNANAAESPYARLESLDKRFDALIAPDTKIQKIADDLKWSEGPLWDARSRTLLFSDIPRNVIMQWNADEGVSTYLERSGYTGAAPFTGHEPGSNGLTFDLQGRLTLCQHGDRRISRREADGTMVPLAVGFNGKKLNSPNDLVFDKQGNLYFTDPPFGLPKQFEDPGKELPFNAVFRVASDGTIAAVVTDLEAPNGLGFSPDYKTLYVANARATSPIWMAYAVRGRWQPRQRSRVRRFIGAVQEGRWSTGRTQDRCPGQRVRDRAGRRARLRSRWHPARPHPHRRTDCECRLRRRRRDPVHHREPSSPSDAHADQRRAAAC